MKVGVINRKRLKEADKWNAAHQKALLPRILFAAALIEGRRAHVDLGLDK
jgi:hypothetical protein